MDGRNQVLVSYYEELKFEGEDKFGETTFEAVRTYSLFFDEDKEQWLISDFKDTNGSEEDNRENKQEMMTESPALLK
ncbi:hypothetical protein [Niallia sp. Krafla_26]|uniref:hypothetical protein n=1 Tax=Niallia sp. Krafla_26 TaxID=3064703 RepID=UPI003D17CC05